MQPLDVDKQMLRPADLRCRSRKRALRFQEFDGVIMRITVDAAIAILIGRFALGACAFNEAIGQKRAGHGIIKLLDLLLAHQPVTAQGTPDFRAVGAVLRAVRAAVVVELDLEGGEIGQVGQLHASDEVFFAHAFLAGTHHDRGAVGVVRADINAPPAAEFLETDPNISLNVFHQVAQVDRPIGVRQGAGNQDAFHGGSIVAKE